MKPSSVAEMRSWCSKYPGREVKKLAKAAIDQFVRLQRKKQFTDSQLRPIVAAAGSRLQHAWELGNELLLRLARQNSVARDALRKLLQSRKAGQRFADIAMLGYLSGTIELPRDFSLELVRIALHDKSGKVREKAAEAADKRRLAGAIPELEARIRIERNRRVRDAVRLCLAMLQDGFVVEYHGGQPTLTVRTIDAWSSHFIAKEDASGKRLTALIRQVLAKRGAPRKPW